MTTEEEAREASDGKEGQVEAMDLEPFHMQTHLDRKLSSMEIKNMRENIDSTEGTLKNLEDKVLVEAPSEIKLPPEHNLNGTTSLNVHMDEENKISNEQLHEDNKKDYEQVEVVENTSQNDKMNKEVNDCLSHGQATTEDSSLLKHEKEEEPEGDDQQDEDPMQDISTKDSDVDRSQIAADRLDHNLDLAKAIEDTQPASMANIPDVEVVAEAHAGVQSPLASDAILDTIDGSTEKDESARVDDAIHHEHRESFPEDTSTAKHTEEVVKAENQQNKQDDTMDEEDTPKSEQEDISKCNKTGVFKETPNSAHADGSTVDVQEVLHQEPSEETNGPANEKQDKTSQQSSMATSDDTISEYDATTCEPPVDTQVHHKESLEEMEDAEAVDTKEEMKQSCAALEEAIPEYHVATTQQDSVETNNTEISETHNAKITPSSVEDKVENNVTATGPTNGDQEVDNAGSTEEIRENIAENNVLVSNVATTDEANKENNMLIVDDIADKHMRGIEPEVTNNTQEDSDQRHVSVLDDSAQEDNTPVSENQQMVSALEIHETEATRTKAVSKESNASVSEEPSPEEYVTESETTRGAKEVNITESLEAIEGDKDTQTREIPNQSNMDSPGKLIQENNAPESETTSDIQPEQESKEMKDTDLVQVNETYPQINATIFQEQAQENNPTTSELHVMESEGGTSNIEATEEQATPHQLGGDHSEEKATEEIITSSEPQALELVQKMNDTEPSRPHSTPQQSIVSPSEESVPEEIAKENIVSVEPEDDAHQQPPDPELAELDEIETNISVEVMEDTEYMKSHGALAGEAAQEENVETEASVDISSVQEPELEEDKNTEPVGTDDNITSSDLPAKRMEKETMKIEAMPHNSPVTNITEVTENNVLTAIAPHADIQPVLEQESVEDKCTAITDKLIGTNQIVGSASDELTPTEENMTMAEPACDTPLQNVIAQEIKDSEDAQTDQFSMPDSFHIPGEAVEESKLPRIEPTSVVLEVQELGSTEETRGIKMVETEDHQQQIASTLEELTEDYKPNVDDHQPNVDDHQVHEEKSTELKDNEAMEAEQVLEKSNITTLCNAPEERSELINDPDCYVQTVQQVESSTDSEDCKLVKEEETSDQQFTTLEHTTQDIAADEIDLPIGMEQEHELESVEEVKDISANKAKHDFHSSQTDALNKLASESNTATTESTRETKSTEGINDEDMACEQTELATSVDSSPKVNEIAPQEHLPPHEENLGNKTYNLMLAQGMKDGLQTSAEQKDDAFDLGETAPNKKSKNKVDEDAIQSSGEDTLETSKSTDQIKERQNDGQDLTQDKDINGEPVTERGTAEASQALIANDAQASQDVTEKDDTIKSGEQTNDQRQSGDVEHRPQTCESPAEDEAVQKINLDERHEEDKEVEPQKQQLLADEQKHKDESDDVGNEPLVESKSAESGTTNRTEEANTLQDPIDVPYSAESGEHEDKECTNKVNDDLLVIQSAKEIVAGTQENKEMQNEAKAVHAESQTKAEEEEMSQLHAKEPHNLDTKVDDTAHGTEIIHDNRTVQPREIEKMGEDMGLGSIYKPVVETSEQNNVEQDFSIHHKAEDEKQESTEDNAEELEAPQQKVTSNVDTNNDNQLPISGSLTKHISESADDVLQLETEGNAFGKADECEKTEASNNKSVPETVTFNEEICDKVTGAEGGLSDESLETFDDTRRNLDAPSVVTASNEGGTNEEKDEHKLAVPAHPTIDENTPEQEMFLSDKSLPAEPEEQEDDQILKEQDEEDMYKPDFGDDQKEVEQDLPVSNFLMNLILGKENSDANGHSEPEAETKQEETRDDNSCLIIPKQEENLVLPPTKNHMEDQDSIEQEKKDAKCSEETHEVVEEQSHDLKLGTETSLETDAELNKDSHHLELAPHQDKMQDEFSNEILSEEAAERFTKIEAKDIAIPSIKQDDGEVSLVCQENTEAATQIKNESLNNNVDDLNNTKLSEEDTLGEGQTGLLPESLNDDRSVNAVSEQTLLLTESGMIDAKSLQSEAGSVQNPVCEMQDKTIESSSTGATSIPDTKVENEEDKTDEKQPATTATGEVAEEHVEISNDNPQNSIGPEATSFEQEPQIVRKVSYTEKALGSEKEISEGSSSTFMDKKEDSDVSVKGVDNIQTDVEIQPDNSNMQINQDKQEATDNKTEMESEKLEEYNIQEQQENGTGQKSPKECHEEDQKFLAERETLEEDVNETVKNPMETINIKSNDEKELSDSKVQERDLNVFSPKDVCEPEESFVEITKPEFRTDEEQSPKDDEMDMSEQKTYEGETKGEEKIRSFTDEETKTEAPAAEQKAAHKKQNLLSGVGSKVKHQLAKVKKAITGKPGRTKPESPK